MQSRGADLNLKGSAKRLHSRQPSPLCLAARIASANWRFIQQGHIHHAKVQIVRRALQSCVALLQLVKQTGGARRDLSQVIVCIRLQNIKADSFLSGYGASNVLVNELPALSVRC